MGRKLVLTGTKLTDLDAPKLDAGFILDTFSRPDADTPGVTEEGGKSYLLEGLGTTGKAIISNGTFGFTGVSPGRSMATVDAGHADGVLSYKVAVDPASSWNYFRVLDYNGYLMVRPFEGTWALWECVGGTRTQIGSSTIPAAAGDLVEVTLDGQNITVRINGATAMTVVESSHATATKYGFGVWGSNAPRWDDFKFIPKRTV